jgi:hypothetical protein
MLVSVPAVSGVSCIYYGVLERVERQDSGKKISILLAEGWVGSRAMLDVQCIALGAQP